MGQPAAGFGCPIPIPAPQREGKCDMGKYVVKRLAYMLVVLVILSFVMFFVYSLIPFDRAVAEADTFKQGMKNNPNE